MSKPKTYTVNAPKNPKDDLVIHLGKVKPRVQMKTVRAASYSFYDKASKKAERKLKRELKEYTFR